jgi:hypothetical protein
MNQFTYRNSTIEVYQSQEDGLIKFDHIVNGVTTRFKEHHILKISDRNKSVSSEWMKSIVDTLGKERQLSIEALKISKDANEYDYFSSLVLADLGQISFRDFVTKRAINGMMQKTFGDDNVFCFNPITGEFFQHLTTDVSVTPTTIDDTDPDNPMVNDDGSISVTPIDGTPVAAKLYDGSVDYLTNLQGTAEQETTDMDNINFTGISGKKRLFMFDADGNFSHRVISV